MAEYKNSQGLPVGSVLNSGKYVIESMLGSGGFGITYFARHTLLNTSCAIKEFFISGKCSRNEHNPSIQTKGTEQNIFTKYKTKFIEEARTMLKIDHPNIVKVIDVFEENGTAYIVMPFIEGQTLSHIVKENGRLDYPTAVNYMAQLAAAVEYIHKRDILHRDIKPDNIMITPDHRVFLIDFGSARQFVHDQIQGQTVVLTHGYAPPEQYEYNTRKGNYTDIYAIGGTFYFALTGVKPVDAGERLLKSLPAPVELFPDIPQEANNTIMKALQMKIEDRHQTIIEFMDDLLEEIDRKKITIGRHGDNNVIFEDKQISRFHAEIAQDESGRFFLTDLNTPNGTFVNGKRITGTVFIKKGDAVQIANTPLPWTDYFNDDVQLPPKASSTVCQTDTTENKAKPREIWRIFKR